MITLGRVIIFSVHTAESAPVRSSQNGLAVALLVAEENREMPPILLSQPFLTALLLRQAKMHDLPLPAQISQ